MKGSLKKLIAAFLAVIMVVGLVPVMAMAEVVKDAIDSAMPLKTGYIHTDMHGARAVSTAYERGDMDTYYELTGKTRDTLPSTYDSRNYGYVTSVKNQGSYGSCWAHAAMACVESYMIKFGVPVGTGSAATTNVNLSETQHCFFNYTTSYDAEGMLTGDKTTVTASGSNNGLDVGGNGEMSAYTLQRWTGAASETTSALAYSKASTVASSGLNSQYAYGSNVTHVQNSEWIPATDIEGVKNAIMKYGAGNISYYAGSSTSTYSYTYQCTIDTTSQDSSSHKWANHAITLIGWDDTIAASSFSPNKPSSPGAWLCKNSWGTSYFNQGYMYISYEDTSVLEGYIYFYDAEAIDNYDHNYQYDGTCNPVCYGKGWPSSADYYVGFANNTQVANVFTAKGTEMLRAIAFCSWDEAMTYTVDVYKNPTTGNPSSGTKVSTASGYLTYSGYYTIPLDTPVMLNAGDTFSVVITQNVAAADDEGYYVHTPYDATFNNSDVVSWANWTHANHGNTSYYKEPNGSWTDCPDNGDYRIKAYTDDYTVTYTVDAVSNNNSYGTVSVTGTIITATPAAGYYVESCTLVSGTATWTISGNTISVAPTSDCTIRVNFAPKPQYTVNFVASGTAQGSQTAYVNDSITLPATVSVDPEGWTFIGWVDAQLAETTDEPTYYAPGAAYTVTGNATLYALFTRAEGEAAMGFQLLTAAPADWTGNYVITNSTTNVTTSGMYVLTGIAGSSSGADAEVAGNATAFASTGITLENNVMTGVANDYIMNIAASGSYYTIQSASTGAYFGMNSSSYLRAYSTINTSYCRWTPAINTSGVAQFKNYANGSYPYFGWSTANTYFWSASTSNANVLRLWKETEVTAQVSYYTTDPVVAQPTYYTVTFKDWNGTVLKTEEVLEGAAATAPADPTREGYTFTGWDVAFNNVTSDLVVTAQYAINTYTVTFKDWDGTVLKTETVNYGGAATAPADPTRDGYTFAGWDVAFNNVTSDLVVTATYTENETPAGLLGDVNCDGKVDMGDISALSAYLLGKGELTAQGLANADASQNGAVDSSDLSAIFALI